ncbi:MAG: hypothetical protein U5K56_02325 [Halioglobus sp.]|nr:hypothetical protein [Halioglobus sp.]
MEGDHWVQRGDTIEDAISAGRSVINNVSIGSVDLSEDGRTLLVASEDLCRVFQYRGNVWQPFGNVIIAPGATPSDTGRSVAALSADGMAIAHGWMPGTSDNQDGTTEVDVYRYAQGDWEPVASPISVFDDQQLELGLDMLGRWALGGGGGTEPGDRKGLRSR